ncbi:DUF4198 domain-containing protein [Klebsiella aerogenes]
MGVRISKLKSKTPKFYHLLFVVLALCSRTTSAHDFWILPHDALAQQDGKVLFELRIGPGWPGKLSARLPGLIASFDAWDQLGKRKVEGHDGSLVIGHIKTRSPGATIAALTTNGAKITLPADEFEDYLREEGLNKVIHARKLNGESAQPGVELFFRCAKTLVFVDNKSNGYDKIIGLERELVPETDPLSYKPGTAFSVKLLQNGVPLRNTQVKAELNSTPPTVLRAITDADGRVSFNLPVAGEWLFSAVDMVASPYEDADWKSIWASLTLPVSDGNKK